MLAALAAFSGFSPAHAQQLVTLTDQVRNPYGLVTGPDGALYICEIDNHRVSRYDFVTRKLSVVVDQSVEKNIQEPYEVRFDRKGDLYFVDMKGHRVYRFERQTRKLSVIAGTGEPGFSGDGGPAASAQLKQPHSIAFDPQGRLLICDIGNHRVRRMDLKTGLIETYIGNGERKAVADGAPASTATALNGPRAIDFDRNGNMYLALREGNAIYRVSPKEQKLVHLAGTGEKGNTGDGGDARKARLNGPKGVSCAPDGSLYLADTENHTIRRINPKGIISTVAGSGARGNGTETRPLECAMDRPHGVFADRRGVVYIGDSEAHKVRVLR
ncbi:MAG: SMP-30/gluconolactonase/LRE family protein [Bryobacteraceae bacterium]